MVMITSGIPDQHLLDRDRGQPAADAAGGVARHELDGLDIDRAAEPGLQPARAARVIDARAALARTVPIRPVRS